LLSNIIYVIIYTLIVFIFMKLNLNISDKVFIQTYNYKEPYSFIIVEELFRLIFRTNHIKNWILNSVLVALVYFIITDNIFITFYYLLLS